MAVAECAGLILFSWHSFVIRMIKAILISCLFSLLVVSSYSQPQFKNAYYLKFLAGWGNYNLQGFSVHHVSKYEFSLSAFAKWELKKSPDLPEDFYPGYYPNPTDKPKVRINSFGVEYGEIFYLSKHIRLDMKAGPLFGRLERPQNFVYIKPTIANYNRNYDYSLKRKWITGVIFNPSIDFLMTDYISLSVGLYGNINTYDEAGGLEIGAIVGLLK